SLPRMCVLCPAEPGRAADAVFEYGREALSMATNPRTRNPGDPALSAVEDALGLERDPIDNVEPRPPRRAAEPVRRSNELAQRPQGSRIPAPPRRSESRRSIEAAAPVARRSEPPRPEDELADGDQIADSGVRDDEIDDAPAAPRPR